jgi:hypothetical protein
VPSARRSRHSAYFNQQWVDYTGMTLGSSELVVPSQSTTTARCSKAVAGL